MWLWDLWGVLWGVGLWRLAAASPVEPATIAPDEHRRTRTLPIQEGQRRQQISEQAGMPLRRGHPLQPGERQESRRNDMSPPGDMSQVRVEFTDRPPSEALRPAFDSRARPPTPPPRVESAGRRHPPDAPPALYGQAGYALLPDEPSAAQDRQEQRLWAPSPLRREDPPCRSPLPAPRPVIGSRQDMPPTADRRVKAVQWAQPCSSFRKEDHDMTQSPSQLNDSRYREPWSSTLAAPPSAGPAPRPSDPYHEPPVMAGARYAPCEDGGYDEPMGGLARRPARSGDLTVNDLAKAIMQASRSSGNGGAPRYLVELPVFTGAASEWLHFRAAFRESAPYLSIAENSARLRKALRGQAFEAISCLFLSGTHPEDIVRRLETRFGRPEALALAEMEKVKALPRMTDEPHNVCSFANKIVNIVATIQALGRTEHLYNPEMARLVEEKLTPIVKSRWFDYEMSATDSTPTLGKLANFLELEAVRNSRHARQEVARPEVRRDPRHVRINVASDKVEEKSPRRISNRDTPRIFPLARNRRECPICKASHAVATCPQFKKETIDARWEIAKKLRLCFRCLELHNWKHKCKGGCKVAGCRNPSHNTVLHQPRSPTAGTAVVSTAWGASRTAFLKVVPVVVAGPKGEVETYALLDDGSTVTLVTDETATAVGAEGPSEPFVIEAVGGAHIDAGTSRRVQIQIKGKYMGAPAAVMASTIPSLDISGQSVDKRDIEDCTHLADIKDELQYLNAIPTILVGQDNWQLLQARDTRVGLRHQPVASMTELGWVLHGVKGTPLGRANVAQKVHRVTTNLDEQLREHFALESLGIRPQRPKSDPDERAEKILRESINQLPDGSYEVGLPWKREDVQLPDSYRAALNRLAGVEKKMNRNEEYGKRYTEQIDRMLAEGYAEEAPASASPDRTWYLPHFGVDNPAKKKLRIVHDAAAQVRGVCLNDALLTGPDLLESLPGVLMRFRQHPVAVTADIKDMFLRIKVQNTDRDALRFLWRKKPHETPISYRMTSVIFGATSSPFTAMFVKNHNAEKHGSENPQAIKSIKRNHYMDDYLESFRSIEEARQTARDVATIHGKGKFSLQRWTATHPAVVADLVSGESPPEALTHQLMNDSEKILGIIWNPKDDFLTYNLNFVKVQKSLLEGTRVPTKRELLSAAMSLYDPLGLVAPVTIQPKHTLQKTWSEGLDWDDPLPEGLHAEWMQWLESVRALKNLKLPRAYRGYSDAAQVELHTFVDASERAYAAAVYWRAVGADGGVQISLAAAKARVAGKVTSIPRLELQAAVLGARLARSVENEHETVVSARHFWSDSTTVLAWLRTGAKAYKPFVAHRIAELEETTKSGEWHWLPTADNVADDATRGIPPHFDSEHRWFAGPGFLYQPPDTWPSQPPTGCGGSGEERISRIDIVESRPRVVESLPDPTRFSSWTRLLRTAARVLQFVDKCRKKAVDKVCIKRTRARAEKDPTWRITKRPCKDRSVPISHVSPENYVPLSADLLQRARCLLLQASQETHFSEERLLLDGGSTVDRSSRLFNLPVKIDKSKLIVINSRIQAADRLTPAQGQPVVVDGDDYTIRLYLRHVHTSFHHGGTELIVNEVRQQFHVLRLRPNVKRVIKECQPCRLRRALPPEPPTGMLPGARLAHHRRPFTYTGVDYFGPIKVTVGRSIQNRYVALFTCLTTRAIHLEVAGSLSTDAAVNALRRLMSRRGCPTELWSDNGTNFHGADKELRAAALAATQQAAEIRAIRWRFIPPGAPFMGGAWERLVRSVKTALAVTVAHHRPSEDTLATLLSEAEHTVNSRPLTHVAVGALDEPALTPMHFILGGPSSVPLPGKFNESDMSSKRHWRAAQRLADMFWDRWTREALPLMRLPQQTHGKGDKVEVGDIVLVVDNNAPRNQWRRAIVTRTFPGTDGVVRTVEIRMDNRTLLRPARKVVVLPVKKMMSSPAERSEDQPAA